MDWVSRANQARRETLEMVLDELGIETSLLLWRDPDSDEMHTHTRGSRMFRIAAATILLEGEKRDWFENEAPK